MNCQGDLGVRFGISTHKKKTLNASIGADEFKIVEDLKLQLGHSKRYIIYKMLKPAFAKLQDDPKSLSYLTFVEIPSPSLDITIALDVEEFQTLRFGAASMGVSVRKLIYAIVREHMRIQERRKAS